MYHIVKYGIYFPKF